MREFVGRIEECLEVHRQLSGREPHDLQAGLYVRRCISHSEGGFYHQIFVWYHSMLNFRSWIAPSGFRVGKHKQRYRYVPSIDIDTCQPWFHFSDIKI